LHEVLLKRRFLRPTKFIDCTAAQQGGSTAVRNFLDNATQLALLRVDWRFRKNWESVADVRMPELRDISQRRQGALASIYRYLGPKMKVGIGYNFTAFSDDLTDLSFDHNGLFLNLIPTQ
jgi:hypothetical protein